MPSSLASSTSETALLTSAMSSSVTPWSRSTTTRTMLRRPAGVTTSSSRSYPPWSTTGAIQPVSRAVAGSAFWVPREPDTASSSSSMRCAHPLSTASVLVQGKWSGYRARTCRLATAGGTDGAHVPHRTPARDARRRVGHTYDSAPSGLRGWGAMSPTPTTPSPGFSRRTLLAASAAGLAVLVAGCSSPPADEREQVTSKQADELAAQVAVQQTLVASFASSGAADPALAAEVAELAAQANDQLTRLKAAAPGSSAAPSSASAGPPSAPEARAWLRGQVAAAADSHAAASVDQSGARAALLGSIAAGLRGQDGRLA